VSSTLDLVALWTAEAFEPLTFALIAGDEETLGLLRDLGYDLQAVPAPITALRQPTQLLMEAVGELLDAIEQQDDDSSTSGYATAATTLTLAVAEVIAAFSDMSSSGGTVLPAGVTPEELARRLVELLVIRELDRRGRKIASILRLLGIVDVELVDPVPLGGDKLPVARLEPQRLVQAISDPAQLARDLYGWGTTDFDAELLFQRVADVAIAFGREFFLIAINQGVASLAGITSDDPDPVLHVPLITDPVELDAVVIGVPADGPKLPGLGLTLELSGQGDIEIPISARTKLVLAAGGSLAGGFLFIARPDGVDMRFDLQSALAASSANASLTLIRSPATGEQRVQLLNVLDVVVLDATQASLGVGGSVSASAQDVYVDVQLKEGQLSVGTGSADGFLAKMLPDGGLRIPLVLHITWSRLGGLRFEGGAGLTIRSAEHRALGPISIELIEVTVILGTTGIQARGTLDLKLALGPIVIVVDKIGAKADIEFKKGNLGPLNFALGFKPPSGAGMSIKAGPVIGGGYVFFDPDNEQYAGILQLSFQMINIVVIGLLTTRLPDASGAPGATKKGFSLLLIVAVDLPPIQLGYGFTLNGVGGLLGVNRTMMIEPLRSGVKNHTVDAILFPQDPIARASQIISDLRNIFPPAEGRFVFGPMVKIGWGPNSIIELSLALVLELLAPIRLVILGRVQLALPDKKDPVLNIRLDLVGVLDFDRSEASVDASLIDSKLTVFALTGDMAMRVSWGATKVFVLAAGGFNRRFEAPPGFPKLDRLGIALANSDNPRLRLGSYFALTPNTIQFGAEVDIYAKADTFVGTFSISALANFDAMIQFQPFEFRADLGASIDVARNGVPFLHAALVASFTGPNPWHAIGYAEFDCCGKHRIDVEATAGTPQAPAEVRIGVGDLVIVLTDAIKLSDAWSALPPPDDSKIVSLCDAPTVGTVAVHPLGSLTLRQRVVPLGKVLTRYGAAIVDGVTFDIAGVSVGVNAVRVPPPAAAATRNDFAPGQFEALTDDEKLARPAFESMRSGSILQATGTGLPADGASGVDAGVEYEEAIVDVEPTSGARTSQSAGPAAVAVLPASIVATLVQGGAAARAPTNAGGADQFAGSNRSIGVVGERYVVANADTLDATAGSPPEGMSCAEAGDALAAPTSEPLETALLHEAA
jgi:hypothetical protein